MAINRIEIKDYLVFKGEFAMDFVPGMNIIIGGNATGKTTLLRCVDLYPLAIFYGLKIVVDGQVIAPVQGFEGATRTGLKFENGGNLNLSVSGGYDHGKTIFIPVAEMLSH